VKFSFTQSITIFFFKKVKSSLHIIVCMCEPVPMNMNCAEQIALACACVNIFEQNKVNIKKYDFQYEVVIMTASFH